MDEGVLRRYSARLDPTGEPPEENGVDDMGSFGWLRGARERAVMLDLRKSSGDRLAIAYSWIERIEFDPSAGIRLHAGQVVATIHGQHLNAEVRPKMSLFDGLVRHRITWIQEADHTTLLPATHCTCIATTIAW